MSLEGIPSAFDNAKTKLLRIQAENSTQQPKVVVFNACIWEIFLFCPTGNAAWIASKNTSGGDFGNCASYYRQNFQRLLNFVAVTFPSDLKIFRTTNAAWMKWGNFGFAWSARYTPDMVHSPHVVKMFNEIALKLIRESGYDVKVYDFFWMTWARPDDTEIDGDNGNNRHMVHMGLGMLKASVRKLLTLAADYFDCFVNGPTQAWKHE